MSVPCCQEQSDSIIVANITRVVTLGRQEEYATELLLLFPLVLLPIGAIVQHPCRRRLQLWLPLLFGISSAICITMMMMMMIVLGMMGRVCKRVAGQWVDWRATLSGVGRYVYTTNTPSKTFNDLFVSLPFLFSFSLLGMMKWLARYATLLLVCWCCCCWAQDADHIPRLTLPYLVSSLSSFSTPRSLVGSLLPLARIHDERTSSTNIHTVQVQRLGTSRRKPPVVRPKFSIISSVVTQSWEMGTALPSFTREVNYSCTVHDDIKYISIKRTIKNLCKNCLLCFTPCQYIPVHTYIHASLHPMCDHAPRLTLCATLPPPSIPGLYWV